MTIVNTFVSKLVVAFVTIAMLFSFSFATTASAATESELQAQIDALLAQIAGLTGGVSAPAAAAVSSSSVCPYNWSRSLSVGDSGPDVMKLQQFLNSNAATRVAASGVGSAGQETDYYGGLTGEAVKKYQTMYSAEILAPLGLVNPTPYFGNSTRGHMNSMCVSAPAPAPAPAPVTGGGDDNDDDDHHSSSLAGEASLKDADLNDGDDTDIEENQEDNAVAEFEVEFEDGDAKITRIDVEFTATGEDDPWDTFESISLWVDGDKVAESNTDDEDDWRDDEQTLRMSGLDIVSREDDTTTIVIGVSTQDGVDNLPATWNVDVTSMRYVDGDGVSETEDPTVSATNFDLEEEGGDDELKIQSSSDDPDSDVFAVETDSNSDWFTVFAVDLDTDDSENDIEVETAVFKVWVNGDVYDQVVNDAQVVVDGEAFDDVTVTNGTTATATLSFDIDKDLVIDAGEEVTAHLQLEFKKLTGNYSAGQSVQASTTASIGWEAEGAENLTVGTQLSGSAVGDEHTVRDEGVNVEPGTHDFDTQGQDDTTGIYTIEFDVTAFENDFYIAKNATSSGTNTDGGVDFTVTGPATPTSASGALSSTADEDTTNVFTVREGETETFTLTVTVDASATGLHSVELNDIWFTANTDGVSSLETDPVDPVKDYRVVDENINA